MQSPIKRLSSALFLFFLTASFASSVQAQKKDSKAPSASGYHLINKIQLGGEGGWDYLLVDDAARRLYVSHATKVIVLDVDTGKTIGEISDTNGIHGVAIASDVGRGFTSNGRDGTVTIFDLKTLKPLGTIRVGTNPDAIIYDPPTHRVFVFNRGSSSFSVIEAADGKIVDTVALGGHPEFAVSDGKGMVYVNLDDKSEVVAIDSRKLEIKSRWPLAPGEGPTGMAIDRKQRRLFVVCENKKMIVMNADNGKIVAALPIGSGVDGTVFDPETKLAFSSNGEGTLTVVQEDSADKFHVVEDVPTQRGARTLALDPKTHRIFLATAEFGPAPRATPERPRPRPTIVPDSFVILVFGK
ncbi:MAG TPA: YncE family protein [Blastocatellia bacterium]|nr:YncE family protein [Blastocatellia bacterium]